MQEIEPLGDLRYKDDDLLVGNQFLEKWLSTEPRRPAFPSEPPRGVACKCRPRKSRLRSAWRARTKIGQPLNRRPPLSPAVRDAWPLIEQLNVRLGVPG